jgi:methylmalonyl-CoA mutase N-terminal domain/subunit
MDIVTTTESGIDIKPLYRRSDVDPERDDEMPGIAPFTRGIHPNMYRDRLWTIRQYSGFGDSEASNERYRSLLAAGQTGLSVAFDLPSQLGFDSDDPVAMPEVGRVGVAVDTIEDLAELFEDIPLDKISVSFTINAPAPVLAAMYVALAKRQGADLAKVRATVQNDILKEFLTRGAYVFPPADSVRLVGDVIEYCNREVPSVYPISVCGSHIRDTGATGIDAISMVLMNGLLYLGEAASRGLDVTAVASRFSFLFCARQDPFMEAAQIRAARRLWAKLLTERFGITRPGALKFRIFSGVSNQMYTRQEPLNNIIRGTLGCLGIVLGGQQAVTVIGFDEAYDIPTEEAQRLALRTQQIIAYETSVPATVDPLAGSYYVEALTDESEQKMREFIERVEDRGGMISSIEDGYLHNLMYERAYELEKQIANGEVTVVGVNAFTSGSRDSDDALFDVESLHEPDNSAAERQVARLRAFKDRRDDAAVVAGLADVRSAAERHTNVCWPLERAVMAGATMGECMSTMAEVFGRYQEGGQY